MFTGEVKWLTNFCEVIISHLSKTCKKPVIFIIDCCLTDNIHNRLKHVDFFQKQYKVYSVSIERIVIGVE